MAASTSSRHTAIVPEAIVALDYASWTDAEPLVHQLGNRCRFYKVGLELFAAEGPRVVHALRALGCDVFLDLKLHDIPNTMAGSARAVSGLGVRLLTVHASAGTVGVAAAVEGAGDGCRVLAVTVLTSLDSPALAASWGRDPGLIVESEVVRLAGVAAAAGAHGVVCSGHEVQAVRSHFGERLSCLVPGIRSSDGATDDQARVMTPTAAAAAGARYLVLGRMIRTAADPGAAMATVLAALGGDEPRDR